MNRRISQIREVRTIAIVAVPEDGKAALKMGSNIALIRFVSSRKSKDNETVCSICLDGIDDCHKKILPCHHSFHAACIRKLKESQSVLCPNCREPFE